MRVHCSRFLSFPAAARRGRWPIRTLPCGGRDVQNGGCFLNGKAAKKSHSMMRLCWASSAASLVNASSKATRSISGFRSMAILLSSVRRGAPPPRLAARRVSRVIHQDVAHHLPNKTKKMRAVLPWGVFLLHQPEVCLVNERGAM